ncbi:Polymer-forming cytoskeletal protein [Sulfidibacter corallicola]|uniref:Polymer-forming cytoskeletal protein n=1 Tax=Sulfidibacter corallicola TaxID=2818388 RepID=A0A8A4U2C8_SULCO|nr:polymer-forming cytoskeletal protein [Sulfidibacter corallicola]QTD52885.1 polymer-forming cytoskeletal protein [Sulfidibacter corallicola]
MGWLDKRRNGKHEVRVQPEIPSKSKGEGTIVGPNLIIEGKLDSKEDIWIAGQIKGELDCASRIVVAANGRIQGRIKCQSIAIFGEVEGNIDAAEEITVEATGKLIGDIKTKVFTNQPGGFFEGYSHMLDGKVVQDSKKGEEPSKDKASKDPKESKDKKSAK